MTGDTIATCNLCGAIYYPTVGHVCHPLDGYKTLEENLYALSDFTQQLVRERDEARKLAKRFYDEASNLRVILDEQMEYDNTLQTGLRGWEKYIKKLEAHISALRQVGDAVGDAGMKVMNAASFLRSKDFQDAVDELGRARNEWQKLWR